MNQLIKYMFFVLIFFGIFFIESFMGTKMNQELSEESRMLHAFIAKEGPWLEKKYSMFQVGSGGGIREGIWLISMSFNRYDSFLSEEEARKLIINCVNDCLEAINLDEDLKPFLKVYTFTAKNLDLTIINYREDRRVVFYPYIALIGASEGKIRIFTEDETTEFGYKTKKYETYDEAVAILQKEKELSLGNTPRPDHSFMSPTFTEHIRLEIKDYFNK